MTDPSLLPEELRERVQAELQPNESLRWVAQPIPGRAVWAALPLVLFAVPWTAFAFFWIWVAARGTAHADGPGRLFPAFGIPFLLFGLGLLASPLKIMRGARRTVYVVTDRRAIVIRGSWGSGVEVRSFEPEKLGDLRRVERPDGSGSLVFGQDASIDARGRRSAADYGFIAIENVREAEEYVCALSRHAPPS